MKKYMKCRKKYVPILKFALGSCSISTSAVLTLDSFMYPISLSAECSVLVSGDCSKRSQYAILARQMPNQQLVRQQMNETME